MAMVRFLLVAVLVLRAAGVPVAAEPPCAAAAARGEVCCMRHQTEAGGDVIGHCGCQAAPDAAGQETSVSTPASEHASLSAVLSGGPSVETIPAPDSDAWSAATIASGPIHSPPRLTGSGFRC
jgi:hypothetical protein